MVYGNPVQKQEHFYLGLDRSQLCVLFRAWNIIMSFGMGHPLLHIKPSLYECRDVQRSQIFRQNWIISRLTPFQYLVLDVLKIRGKSYWSTRIAWGHVTSRDWLVSWGVTNYINCLQLLGIEYLLCSLWVHMELTLHNSGVHPSWQQPLHWCPSIEWVCLLQQSHDWLEAAQPLVGVEHPNTYIYSYIWYCIVIYVT